MYLNSVFSASFAMVRKVLTVNLAGITRGWWSSKKPSDLLNHILTFLRLQSYLILRRVRTYQQIEARSMPMRLESISIVSGSAKKPFSTCVNCRILCLTLPCDFKDLGR